MPETSVAVTFPYEGLAVAVIELIGVIWNDLTPEQKKKVIDWSLEDIEKARKFWEVE